jgi:hypothetical protein
MANWTLSFGVDITFSFGDTTGWGSAKKEALILPLWSTKVHKRSVVRAKNIIRNRDMPHPFSKMMYVNP